MLERRHRFVFGADELEPHILGFPNATDAVASRMRYTKVVRVVITAPGLWLEMIHSDSVVAIGAGCPVERQVDRFVAQVAPMTSAPRDGFEVAVARMVAEVAHVLELTVVV